MLHPEEITWVLQVLQKEYGDTGTALKFQTPFQLLVSTMLAAQSTDKQVNKITRELYRKYPDARAFARLTPEELEQEIRSIGLYRNKARNIIAMSRMLLEKFGGEVPQTREELMQLPGVGRKTANVVLSVGFNQDAIAVDTHVFRVANRIGLAQAPNVQQTEEQLMRNIPRHLWSAAHHWLIWHGRRVCRAQNPRCQACPLTPWCQYYQKTASKLTPEKASSKS